MPVAEQYASALDTYQWSIVCMPGRVLYAQRPSRDECLALLVAHAHLIRYFGRAVVEPPVVTELRHVD